MKNGIYILILLAFLGALALIGRFTRYYTADGVVKLSTPSTAVLIDSRGIEWKVQVNKQLAPGTKIKIHFFDSYTDTIVKDDVVKDITIVK